MTRPDTTRPQPGPARQIAPRSRTFLVQGGGALVLLALIAFPVVGVVEVSREWIAILLVLPATLAAVVAGTYASREPRVTVRARRAWLLLTGAHGSYALGILLGGHRFPLSGDPPGILPVALLLLFYPLFLAGLLALRPDLGRRQRVFWLDTATALLTGAIVFWYVVPPVWHAGVGAGAGRMLAVGTAVGDYLLVVGLAALLFRRSLPGELTGHRLLGASIVAIWVAQIGDALLQSSGAHGDSAGYLWVRAVQALLVAWSAHAVIANARRRRTPRVAEISRSARRFAFPMASFSYVGIAIGYAIMLRAAGRGAPTELQAMVGVGGVLVALMVIRQSIVIRDSERARESIQASEEHFRALVQHSSDVVTVVDPDGFVRYQGASAERVLGRAPLAPGTPLVDELHPEDGHLLFDTLQQALRSGRIPVRREWRARHADGSWLHLETVATNLIGDGVIDGIVLNSSDLTERKALEEELTHRAFHDPLTGLANRALFSNILDLALIRSRRSGNGTAVLFLDLDNFKPVNDLLGHEAGDSLLEEVSERLRREVRVSDTVARLGGDEFAILLDDMKSRADALPVTQRILGALRITVPTGQGSEIAVTASIGLAVATGVESREEMLRMADAAMYEAKRAGGNRLLDYAELRARIEGSASLEEADLRRALDLGEFAVRYQPIRSVEDGRITSVVAEGRWFHPRQGLLPPEEFLPLAESCGHDLILGYRVLEDACRQVAIWQRRFGADHPLGLNLRVTPRQILDPALPEQVRVILARTGLATGSLVLEVTECDLIDRGPDLLRRLYPIRELGVRLAVTEFGAGARVLNTLERFPLDMLRLDPALVEELASGGRLAASAVLSLGRSLNIQTIAAGVDAPELLEALRELGCELALGRQIGAPVSRDQLEDILRTASNHSLPAAS